MSLGSGDFWFRRCCQQDSLARRAIRPAIITYTFEAPRRRAWRELSDHRPEADSAVSAISSRPDNALLREFSEGRCLPPEGGHQAIGIRPVLPC